MLKFVLLTFITWLFLVSTSSSMSIVKRGQVQICGKVLAQTLNLLCKGEYYDPEEEENDVRRNIRPQTAADNYREWSPGFPFRRANDMDYRSSVQPNGRQQRGVVDECCKQSCSPSVLLSYCRSRNQ